MYSIFRNFIFVNIVFLNCTEIFNVIILFFDFWSRLTTGHGLFLFVLLVRAGNSYLFQSTDFIQTTAATAYNNKNSQFFSLLCCRELWVFIHDIFTIWFIYTFTITKKCVIEYCTNKSFIYSYCPDRSSSWVFFSIILQIWQS